MVTECLGKRTIIDGDSYRSSCHIGMTDYGKLAISKGWDYPSAALTPGIHTIVSDGFVVRINENYEVIPINVPGISEPIIGYSVDSLLVINDKTRTYRETKLGSYEGRYVCAGKKKDDRILRAFILKKPLDPFSNRGFIEYD